MPAVWRAFFYRSLLGCVRERVKPKGEVIDIVQKGAADAEREKQQQQQLLRIATTERSKRGNVWVTCLTKA